MNSKKKGNRGELEIAHKLQDHGFTNARRVMQYKGGVDSPDVIGLPGVHCEIKRVEKINIHKCMEQAIRDSEGKLIPVVFHRRNREDWLVTMRFEEFMELYKEWLKNITG